MHDTIGKEKKIHCPVAKIAYKKNLLINFDFKE